MAEMKFAPCPFCGEGLDLHFEIDFDDDCVMVLCHKCEAQGPRCKDKDIAEEAWNQAVRTWPHDWKKPANVIGPIGKLDITGLPGCQYIVSASLYGYTNYDLPKGF